MTGTVAAAIRGEPAPFLMRTDDEQELGARAWRFLMPAHERSHFEALLADLARTRLLPPSAHPDDPTAYHRALTAGPLRSPVSRYRRLAEDALADAKLIVPFTVVARRVLSADRVRLRSIAYVRDATEGQVRAAIARIAENRCLIAWADRELQERAVGYRYALEQLLLEAPQGEAVEGERALATLDRHRPLVSALAGGLAPLPFCAGAHPEDATPAVTEREQAIVKG